MLMWRPMITGQVSDGRIPPSLLLAHDFRKNGYDVYVTDLVHIWAESMDRRAINKRALMTDTSIDPTEDDEQMKLLLDKVKQGLEQGHDSELTMTIRSNGNEYGEGRLPIYMKVKVDLPKPFKPLEWTLELEPCDQSKFTNELVIPLIEAQDEARNEVSSLMAVIRQKDHVIQKLVDKLEASGTELGQVFPSATGKGGGKLTRKVVEERVAGLAPFNHQTWQEEFNHAEAQKGKDAIEQFDELMGRCFVDPGLDLPSGHRGIEEAQTTWWREIKGETITICENCHWDGSPVARANAAREKGQQATTENPEENLQVPATPPQARHQPQTSPIRNLHNRHVVDDDDTDDEDLDSASQSQPAKVPDSFRSPKEPASKPPTKKLGGIGGKKSSKARSQTPPPAQPSRSSQSQTIIEDDDTTEGEDDGFEEAQPKKKPSPEKEKPSSQKRAMSPTPEPKEASPKKTPKKGGLGKIGGKKKLSPPPVTEQGEKQAGGSQMPSRTKPKLGHVSGKKDGDEEDGRGRSVEKEEERPRETSAEARQRRKREMEERLEKEAARPKKKKRIF